MRDDVSTQQWLYDACNELAIEACGEAISLDVCAEPWSAKCDRYWTRADDALTKDWTIAKAAFCNPSYSKPTLHLWIEKALEASRKGTTVVLVLPQWNYPWYDLCEKHGRVHRVVGPVRFHPP